MMYFQWVSIERSREFEFTLTPALSACFSTFCVRPIAGLMTSFSGSFEVKTTGAAAWITYLAPLKAGERSP
jgi:hypothetical protein